MALFCGRQQAKLDAERVAVKKASERAAVLQANAAAEAARRRAKELSLEEDRKIAEYIAGEEEKKRCVTGAGAAWRACG